MHVIPSIIGKNKIKRGSGVGINIKFADTLVLLASAYYIIGSIGILYFPRKEIRQSGKSLCTLHDLGSSG